ncbi:sentrin-specific protease 6 isoform X2 [Brachyhypopomus gauderio]|uniref:sentrin-specific protease 6 isoform X2 n=1 Tax=Brachyhypopomus gauderio TaxID=698409 RepID=UPI0040410BFC
MICPRGRRGGKEATEKDKCRLTPKSLRGNATGFNMVGIGQIFSEASQTMTQNRKESSNFTLLFKRRTAPAPGGVLQRPHFCHSLASDGRTNAKRRDVTEELNKSNEVLLIRQDGPDDNRERVNTKELKLCTDTQSLLKHARMKRMNRMRDQNGDLVPKKGKTRALTSVVRFPSINWSGVEGRPRVTLNVRSLQFGTLSSIFRGPLTFSVDYWEIPGVVRIQASELTSCEWCRGCGLPVVFLQMTPVACSHWRAQLQASMAPGAWYDCHSKNQEEKYMVIIFENEPTILEKAAFGEMLAEIGRFRSLVNFPAILTFEEASSRLIAHKHMKEIPGSLSTNNAQMATITVSDSEDENANVDGDDDNDEDLMECLTSQTLPVRKLLVYPPPPAKGGFSITEEDLGCLNEGELLNDVILDFYLKYLVCEKLKKEDANRCHVFSSFFYRSLTQKAMRQHPDATGLSKQERRHTRVKTWTRHFDLFEKDFIFIPVNKLAHWYLVVICFPGHVSRCSVVDTRGNEKGERPAAYATSPCLLNPMSLFYRRTASEQLPRWNGSVGQMDHKFCFVSDDDMDEGIQFNGTTSGNVFSFGKVAVKRPCILIMDSLSCSAKPTVVKVLQEYLEMEWWVKKGSWQSFGQGAMNGWSLQVPQQDNSTDCGLYLLQYVESFITNPPQICHPAVDLSDWFPQRLVKAKRKQIKRLIVRLHHQQLGH